MKKNIILILALIVSSLSFGQSQQKIKYIFPDAVEIAIDSCLSKAEKSNLDFHFYLLLEADSSLYSVAIGRYTKNESKNILPWIKQTNRYAVVNKRLLPLIFDYDLKFSTKWYDKIGSFKNRDSEVSRVKLLLHSVIIYFNHDSTIVRKVDW